MISVDTKFKNNLILEKSHQMLEMCEELGLEVKRHKNYEKSKRCTLLLSSGHHVVLRISSRGQYDNNIVVYSYKQPVVEKIDIGHLRKCYILSSEERILANIREVLVRLVDHKRDKIRNIAERIRTHAEFYAVNNNFSNKLEGVCAVASSELFKAFREVDIHSIIHVSIDKPKKPEDFINYHTFLTVEDYVIDVTATQFKRPKILIEKLSSLEKRRWFWKTHLKFESVEDLRNWQQSFKMPEDQLAKI